MSCVTCPHALFAKDIFDGMIFREISGDFRRHTRQFE